jgi:hypothetical protein
MTEGRQRRDRQRGERGKRRAWGELRLRACVGDDLPCRDILVHLALGKLAANAGDLSLGKSLTIGPACAVMRTGLSGDASHPNHCQDDRKE